MVQESATEVSPSSSTGTFSDLCGAIAPFSVKHQGIDSADSPLWASAIRVRQQNGLKGRASSVPTSSKSLSDIAKAPCPTLEPSLRGANGSGLSAGPMTGSATK